MEFSQSKTYKNLEKAFEGELKAGSKYQLFSNQAKEEGLEQIGDIFHETGHNEQEHAEIWWRLLHGGEMTNTLENLKNAFSGEHEEWTKMYKDFAKTAREEGFEDIAKLFEEVGEIERHHDARYQRLLENLEAGKVFCKDKEYLWICMNCGNLYRGKCAPKWCPVCGYAQGYYRLNCENY